GIYPDPVPPGTGGVPPMDGDRVADAVDVPRRRHVRTVARRLDPEARPREHGRSVHEQGDVRSGIPAVGGDRDGPVDLAGDRLVRDGIGGIAPDRYDGQMLVGPART